MNKLRFEALSRERLFEHEKYVHIAKEIVRGMTNAKLSDDQQLALLHVAEIVLKNKFGYWDKYRELYNGPFDGEVKVDDE